MQSKENKSKLLYMNGLKGTGALIVYLCHFAYAFYFALYSLLPEHSHTANNIEGIIGKTPLNILYNGNFSVQLFFAASGFLLCIRYFQTKDKHILYRGAAKRYFRLVVPILFVNTVIFFLMKAGLYQNTAAAAISGSESWFAGFNSFEPGYSHALREALIGCFLFGHNYFNGVLWTVKYLFLGAIFVYLLCAVFGEKSYRYVVYTILSVCLIPTDFGPFVWGLFLSDLAYHKAWFFQRDNFKKLISCVCLIVGIYLGSYPSIGSGLERSIYGGLPVYAVLYHRIGAFLILTSVVCSTMLQRAFSMPILVELGNISFSWYLIHFPVIAVFSAGFLLKMQGHMSYHGIMLIDFIVTTVFVWGLSYLMTKWIEQPWNRWISKK